MALARYSFLPWLRRGIANQIQAAANGSPRAEMTAVLTLETQKSKSSGEGKLAGTATQQVRLVGPGDIIGINQHMIVRTEPRNWVTDFEPNYLAFVEFYDEDFPWRYTPEPPANHRLKPWLALMVLTKDEFERVTIPGRPLPAVKLKAGVNWQNFMPADAQTWAWAHVHINAAIDQKELSNYNLSGADRTALDNLLKRELKDHNLSGGDLPALDNLLKSNPDRGISRLISPRHLQPKTGYHAFLVPAFEVGRKAGLGEKIADNESGIASSWTGGKTEFPVYFEWYFATGESGDFETLVRRLEPRDMDSRVGIRNLDVQQPGYGVDDVDTKYTDPKTGVPHPDDVVGLEGALKAPTTRSIPLFDSNFEEKIAPVINQQFDLTEEDGPKPAEDPTIVPPLYGQWHAMAKRLGIEPGDTGWVNDLNKDPRHRAVSGIGTGVIQKNQEDYMRTAWQQIGDVLEMNRLIRDTQVSMWVTQMMFDKHLKTMVPERTLQITLPVHNKIKGSPVTIRYLVRNSRLPQAALSGSFRKITRPNGLIAKRLLPDGEQTPAIIQGLNDGTLTAAPPLVLPEDSPNLGTLEQGLRPKPKPPKPPKPPTDDKPAEPTIDPWYYNVPTWILLLLALILLGMMFALSEFWIPIVGLLVIVMAFVDVRHFFKQPTPPPVVPPVVDGGDGDVDEPDETGLTDVEKDKAADTFDPDKMTPGSVDETPPIAVFELTPPGESPSQPTTFLPPKPDGSPPDPADEKPPAKDFRDALTPFFEEIQVNPPVEPERPPLNIPDVVPKITAAITPLNAYPKWIAPKCGVGGGGLFEHTGKYFDAPKFPTPGTGGTSPGTPPPHGIGIEVERIVEVMAYPHFKQPMYESLRDLSPDLFVPNLNLIPPNTLSLMVANQPFIEAYMVGLNHEFSRELLWREYPTDQRGSYFRQFWDVKSVPNMGNLPQKDFEEKLKDIREIHRWGVRNPLGGNDNRKAKAGQERLVLVVRGDLLKRYPNTVIYAMRAKWDTRPDFLNNLILWDEGGENLQLDPANIQFPIYKAEVKPDITFLGFDLTVEDAKGADNLAETTEARVAVPVDQLGWFFVLKEVPGEPRFGLDEEISTNTSPDDVTWDNLSWKNFGENVPVLNPTAAMNPVPPGKNPDVINWNSNAANLAYILYQKPVLTAIHAKEMLKNLKK